MNLKTMLLLNLFPVEIFVKFPHYPLFFCVQKCWYSWLFTPTQYTSGTEWKGDFLKRMVNREVNQSVSELMKSIWKTFWSPVDSSWLFFSFCLWSRAWIKIFKRLFCRFYSRKNMLPVPNIYFCVFTKFIKIEW